MPASDSSGRQTAKAETKFAPGTALLRVVSLWSTVIVGKKKHGAHYWTPRSFQLAEWTGLEPATPGVTGRYSNQLNYHSILWWVLRGSNPRPSPCKGDALPAELSTQSSGLRFLRKISIPAMA